MEAAAVLEVLVHANTAQANAALAATEKQMKGTAATAVSSGGRIGTAMKAASLGAIAVGATAVKMSVDFNQAMTQIETQAGAPQGEIAKLRKEVLGLAKASEFSPKELADGLFRVESAGFRGAKAMETLDEAQKLASVGQSDLESTTQALTAAINSGIKGAGTAAEAVGTLNAAVGQGSMRMEDLVGALSTGILPSAKSFGLTLRDVTAAIDDMTRAGVPAQAAATRLRMTFSLMAAPTDGAVDALKGIGLESDTLAKAMRKPDGLITAVDILKEHLGEMSKTEQSQAISKIFGGGRTSSAITQLIQDSKTLTDIYDTTAEKSKEFGEAVEQQESTSAARLATAWNTVQVGLIDLGQTLEGPVVDAITGQVSVGEQLVGVVTNLPAPLYGAITGLAAAYAATRLWAGAMVVATAVVKGTTAAIEYFKTAALAMEVATGAAQKLRVMLMTLTMSNPFTAIIGGATVLAGVIAGILMDNDDVVDSQQEVRDATEQVAAAYDKQREAMQALHDFSLDMADARHREKEAALQVEVAENNLDDARSKYGKHSLEVRQAEEQLTGARLEHRRAAKEASRTEKELDDRAKHAAYTNTQATHALMDKKKALKEEKEQLKKAAEVEETYHGKTKKLLAIQDALADTNTKLKETQNKLRDSQDAAGTTLAEYLRGLQAINPSQKKNEQGVRDYLVQLSRQLAQTRNASKENKGFKGTADLVGKALHNTGKDVEDAGKSFGTLKDIVTNLRGAVTSNISQINAITNKSLSALGVAKVDFAGKKGGGKTHRKAVGGVMGMQQVPGKGSGDSYPLNVRLEPGEYFGVINKQAAAQVDALNKEFPRYRLATGGVVPAVDQAINLVQSKFPSMAVTSTTGGGHAANSYHYQGKAVDMSSDANTMLQAASYIKNAIGSSLLEGIHNPNLSIANGAEVDSSYWGSATWADHVDHIHMALDQLGKIAGGAMGFAAKVPNFSITGPEGNLKGIGDAASSLVVDAANQYIQSKSPGIGDTGIGVASYHGPLDKTFPSFSVTQGTGGQVQLSTQQVASVTKATGLPSYFPKIALGESTNFPGIMSTDGGNGLFQMTPRTWGPDLQATIGSMGSFFNPADTSRQAAYLLSVASSQTPNTPGFPWYGTQYLKHGGTFSPDIEFGDPVGQLSGKSVPAKIKELYSKLSSEKDKDKVAKLQKRIDRLNKAYTRTKKHTRAHKLDIIKQQGGMQGVRKGVKHWQGKVNTMEDQLSSLETAHGNTTPRDIEDMLKNIQGVDPDADLSTLTLPQRAQLEKMVNHDYGIEEAENASETKWVTRILKAMMTLRRKLLIAIKKADKDAKEQEKKVRKALKDKDRVDDRIKDTTTRLKKLNKQLEDVKDAEKPKRGKHEKQSDYDDRVKQWEHGHKAHLNEIQTLVAQKKWQQKQDQASSQYYSRVVALAKDNKGQYETFSSESKGSLKELQGEGRSMNPKAVLKGLDAVGVPQFGGSILDYQQKLFDLGATGANAVIRPELDYTAGTGTDGGGTNQTDQILELKLDDALATIRRLMVGAAQGPIYAGMFAKGGVIPSGQIGIAGETGIPELIHGPARVVSAEASQALMDGGSSGPREVIVRVVVEGGDIVVLQDEDEVGRIAVRAMNKATKNLPFSGAGSGVSRRRRK